VENRGGVSDLSVEFSRLQRRRIVDLPGLISHLEYLNHGTRGFVGYRRDLAFTYLPFPDARFRV
jgi:hypothetical protein